MSVWETRQGLKAAQKLLSLAGTVLRILAIQLVSDACQPLGWTDWGNNLGTSTFLKSFRIGVALEVNLFLERFLVSFGFIPTSNPF